MSDTNEKYSERDVLRIERKIAKAMNERKEKKALDSYASEKIKNIHTFLEKFDSENPSGRNSVISSSFVETESKLSDDKENRPDLINYPESRRNLQNLKIELDEAKKTIDSLKKAVDKEKVRNKELEIMYEQRERKNLAEQKEELEGIIQGHLNFIDQLVADKKELNEQCEKLLLEVKEFETRKAAEISELKEKFTRELKSNKDAWVAAEKVRKEKWIQEKTAEIKEGTIKGLEPEIERILSKGKQDIKKLEDKHQKELNELREELYSEFESKMRQHKEKVARENDEIMAKEREYLSNKTKEQYDKFEQKYLEDRDKLKKIYEGQLENVENERRREKENFEERLKEVREEESREIRRIKKECEELIEEERMRMKNELNRMKDMLEGDQKGWFEKQDKKMKTEYEEKLKAIREDLEKERDEQIEMIISRLGEENVDAGFAVREKYEKKISEMKEAHEEDIKKVKREVHVLETKMREIISGKEAMQENLEVISKKLVDVQTRLDIKERENSGMKIALESDRTQMEKLVDMQRDIELTWRKRMETEKMELNKEMDRLKDEISEMKKYYSREYELLEEKHADVLEDVEKKIKKVMMKKESDIKALKEELQVKAAACAKYEELLDKQRKNLYDL